MLGAEPGHRSRRRPGGLAARLGSGPTKSRAHHPAGREELRRRRDQVRAREGSLKVTGAGKTEFRNLLLNSS